jgi:L-threonylcarbamoyladenylate synthase
MKIIKLTKNNEAEVVRVACEVLSSGGILVYPTETTYGLGVDPTNPEAVKKLFTYKERVEGKAISIAVANTQMAMRYAQLNDSAQNLYKNFLPGPITVISAGTHSLVEGIESEKGTIGIRIPDYPFMLDLLATFDKPITATSANAYYQKRPYSVEDILDTISQKQKDLIDLVVDAGQLPKNPPSTVVDTTLQDLAILRQGSVVLQDATTYVSKSVGETQEYAKEVLEIYGSGITKKPLVFALQGEMGAGKTHFTKGIAKALGISETLNSPTFSLEEEYPFIHDGVPGKLIHIDTWRMFTEAEFSDLHVEKHLAENAVIVIEWAEKISHEIEKMQSLAHVIWIQFHIEDEHTRSIEISEHVTL